jgi:hypothetical protein
MVQSVYVAAVARRPAGPGIPDYRADGTPALRHSGRFSGTAAHRQAQRNRGPSDDPLPPSSALAIAAERMLPE